MLKKIVLVIALACSTACAGALKPPPQITQPADVRVWQANEAVIGLRALMRSAIELNETPICSKSATGDVNLNSCHPVLSEQNTRIVVQGVRSAVEIIGETPNGWASVMKSTLNQISYFLDQAGKTKLLPYLQAADMVLTQLLSKGEQ